MQKPSSKLIIGITGSVAAYKSILLIRRLIEEGYEVEVILTPSARSFVSEQVISALTDGHLYIDFFKDGMWVRYPILAEEASLIVVAPATLNTMAKVASGIADNILLTTIFSAKCPVFFFPAMEENMWNNPVTQNIINQLRTYGYFVWDPDKGKLASGKIGIGRFKEPNEIFNIIKNFFQKREILKGKKVLITGGPTIEPIDPVRGITNFSSGKLACELVNELSQWCEVTFIHGPSLIFEGKNWKNTKKISVRSAKEMQKACNKNFMNKDLIIMAAAVADFAPAIHSNKKIKKSKIEQLKLILKKNPDILSELGKKKRENQILVGFALEDTISISKALAKLREKQTDIIVQNTYSSYSGPGKDFFEGLIVSEGKSLPLSNVTKREAAKAIVDFICEFIADKTRS